MGKEQFFLIGRNDYYSNWEIISTLTEDAEEARKWYDHEMSKKKRHFIHIQIGKTIYG